MGMLALHRRMLTAFVAGLIGIFGIGLAASAADADKADRLTKVDGTIWVANRGAHTIRGFDAATGSVVSTVAMAAGSQPAGSRLRTRQALRGRGVRHAAGDRDRRSRHGCRREADRARSGLAAAPRPQESPRRPRCLRALRDGQGRRGRYRHGLAARPVGYRPEEHLGRDHAAVFSKDGRTLYVASDTTGEVIALEPWTGEVLWRMDVPGRTSSPCPKTGRRPS